MPHRFNQGHEPQDPNQQQYPPQGYPQHYQPPAPQPQKRKKWPFVLGGLVLVCILAFAGCMSALSSAVESTGITAGPKTLVYSLDGDGSAQTVTYSNDSNGSVSQEGTADLPWAKEITFESLSVPILTAQRAGGNQGKLTCRITDKATGKVLAESSASGPYAVASCSGGLK